MVFVFVFLVSNVNRLGKQIRERVIDVVVEVHQYTIRVIWNWNIKCVLMALWQFFLPCQEIRQYI